MLNQLPFVLLYPKWVFQELGSVISAHWSTYYFESYRPILSSWGRPFNRKQCDQIGLSCEVLVTDCLAKNSQNLKTVSWCHNGNLMRLLFCEVLVTDCLAKNSQNNALIWKRSLDVTMVTWCVYFLDKIRPHLVTLRAVQMKIFWVK